MSSGGANAKDIQKPAAQPAAPLHDWILANLVDLANRSSLEQDVTLFVSGVVISGYMISAQSYLSEMAEAYRSTEADPSMRDVLDNLAQAFEDTKKRLERIEEATPAGSPPRVDYIHLRDARVHSPSMPKMSSGHGMLWRGRLSCVDAFTLGSPKVVSTRQ